MVQQPASRSRQCKPEPAESQATPAPATSPPQPLHPSRLADLSTRLFAPTLFSRRPDKPPLRPSLRSSLLPPPGAEIDERPRSRVRRFRLWREGVPDMRVCCVDQKRRYHLKRWQPFVIPSNPLSTIVNGSFKRMYPYGPAIPREPFGVAVRRGGLAEEAGSESGTSADGTEGRIIRPKEAERVAQEHPSGIVGSRSTEGAGRFREAVAPRRDFDAQADCQDCVGRSLHDGLGPSDSVVPSQTAPDGEATEGTRMSITPSPSMTSLTSFPDTPDGEVQGVRAAIDRQGLNEPAIDGESDATHDRATLRPPACVPSQDLPSAEEIESSSVAQCRGGQASGSAGEATAVARELPSDVAPTPGQIESTANPPIVTISPTPFFTYPTAPPLPAPPRKLSRTERHARRERLKQHKWVLDVEHERRFRAEMRRVMDEVILFQDGNTHPFHQWERLGAWKADADVERIKELTDFFKALRRSSSHLFAKRGILPVPGRKEVVEALKAEQDAREQRRRERRAKRERNEYEKEKERAGSGSASEVTLEQQQAGQHSESKTQQREQSVGVDHQAQSVETVPAVRVERVPPASPRRKRSQIREGGGGGGQAGFAKSKAGTASTGAQVVKAEHPSLEAARDEAVEGTLARDRSRTRTTVKGAAPTPLTDKLVFGQVPATDKVDVPRKLLRAMEGTRRSEQATAELEKSVRGLSIHGDLSSSKLALEEYDRERTPQAMGIPRTSAESDKLRTTGPDSAKVARSQHSPAKPKPSPTPASHPRKYAAANTLGDLLERMARAQAEHQALLQLQQAVEGGTIRLIGQGRGSTPALEQRQKGSGLNVEASGDGRGGGRVEVPNLSGSGARSESRAAHGAEADEKHPALAPRKEKSEKKKQAQREHKRQQRKRASKKEASAAEKVEVEGEGGARPGVGIDVSPSRGERGQKAPDRANTFRAIEGEIIDHAPKQRGPSPRHTSTAGCCFDRSSPRPVTSPTGRARDRVAGPGPSDRLDTGAFMSSFPHLLQRLGVSAIADAEERTAAIGQVSAARKLDAGVQDGLEVKLGTIAEIDDDEDEDENENADAGAASSAISGDGEHFSLPSSTEGLASSESDSGTRPGAHASPGYETALRGPQLLALTSSLDPDRIASRVPSEDSGWSLTGELNRDVDTAMYLSELNASQAGLPSPFSPSPLSAGLSTLTLSSYDSNESLHTPSDDDVYIAARALANVRGLPNLRDGLGEVRNPRDGGRERKILSNGLDEVEDEFEDRSVVDTLEYSAADTVLAQMKNRSV